MKHRHLWLPFAIALILFVSGACSLLYQTVWLREFRLILGGSTAAAAAVVAVFMGGLGLGGWWFGARVEQVRFPLAQPGQRSAFTEFSARHGDFAIVSAAAVSDARGLCLAIGGVADRPRLAQWPASLRGAELDSALNDFAWELEAQDDAHASATFRRHLVRQLGAQVIAQVTETS